MTNILRKILARLIAITITTCGFSTTLHAAPIPEVSIELFVVCDTWFLYAPGVKGQHYTTKLPVKGGQGGMILADEYDSYAMGDASNMLRWLYSRTDDNTIIKDYPGNNAGATCDWATYALKPARVTITPDGDPLSPGLHTGTGKVETNGDLNYYSLAIKVASPTDATYQHSIRP